MDRSANVRSIPAIDEFRAALLNFDSEVKDGLATVETAIRRSLDWLKCDQLVYWRSEVRRAENLVTDAKADLDRCRIATVFGRTPDCTDQKLALKRARQRLEETQAKIDSVRRWERVLEKEIGEFQGPARQLANWLDGNLPQAVTQLDRLMAALDRYVALGTGSPPGEASMSVESEAVGEPRQETAKITVADQAPLHEAPAGRPPSGDNVG